MTNLTDAVKERLKYYVEQSVDDIYVSTDWNIDLAYVSSYPAATIKFEPIVWQNVTYGRSVPESGSMVEITFSIWVADEEDTTYLDEHPSTYPVLDTVDLIIDYLLSVSEDQTERNTYNINKIYEISVDEGGSSGTGRRINIMILKGKIEAKWLD